jgi:hypothetical protein
MLSDEFGCVVTRTRQTPPYQFRVQPGPAPHLNLIDAGQGISEGVVYGTEARHVRRGGQLFEIFQAGERIGNTG